MNFVVRGRIGPGNGNDRIVGRYTYLARQTHGYYAWDGEHKAALFDTKTEALSAAISAKGPVFSLPDPASIEVIPAR